MKSIINVAHYLSGYYSIHNLKLLISWPFVKLKHNNDLIIPLRSALVKARSRTVFIIGSGYSLNRVRPEHIKLINENDIITFNNSHHAENFTPLFHVSRRISNWKSLENDHRLDYVTEGAKKYMEPFHTDRLKNTILLLQWEPRSFGARVCSSASLFPKKQKIVTYHTSRDSVFTSLKDYHGLVHSVSVLSSALHLALLGGWEKIVLVGFDLDKSYFWLNPWETSEIQSNTEGDLHSSVANGVIPLLKSFNDVCEAKRSKLFTTTYNSALLSFLPFYL